MLSFCRSGLLALTLVSGFMVSVEGQVRRIEHRAWASDVAIERLQDNSLLTEYFGETRSSQTADVILRVGFIPRFGCAPLITLKYGLIDPAQEGQTKARNPSELKPEIRQI